MIDFDTVPWVDFEYCLAYWLDTIRQYHFNDGTLIVEIVADADTSDEDVQAMIEAQLEGSEYEVKRIWSEEYDG